MCCPFLLCCAVRQVRDRSGEDLGRHLPMACKFVHTARAKQGRVCVYSRWEGACIPLCACVCVCRLCE